MTKTTFLGYVPSLKSKHEATIVNGRAMKSKGGSIRYLLEGEYDGRKTLPKTVSKEDFVKVYGFDAKEAEAVIISGLDGRHKAHKIGKEENDGFTPVSIVPIEEDNSDMRMPSSVFENHADTVGSPSPADVEPPAPSEKPFPQEPSNENFSAESEMERYSKHRDEILEVKARLLQENEDDEMYIDDPDQEAENDAIYEVFSKYYPEIYGAENFSAEVKEALGLFGKKEEEEKEESDEPKTQEFTVVLQEGDKLELTDIPEEKEEEVSEEKEEQEALPDDETAEKEEETAEIEEKEAETYEAVQAKVTRPVKEEETEDEEEESEEGLSTGAKVALGVGALAVGAAIFGAEGEYPEEFLDEFYDFDSNPTADTQDEETIAIAYAAWLESKKNEDDYIPYESETDYSRIYGASVNVGEKRIMSRKDYDIDNELSGFSNMDYNLDLDDHEDEIAESVESEIIDAIRESVDENLPISDGDSGSGSVNVDTEIEISVPISGDIDYEWDATINHEDDEHDEDWNAEHESESDGYTYAYTKGHKDGMDNEVIYRPSIETDREKTIFKKILKQKADTVGNPSPSGPSSTPEPAEATGSEPSNEEFKADNTKMALGLLGLGIGAVALLGGDRIKKLFDRFG